MLGRKSLTWVSPDNVALLVNDMPELKQGEVLFKVESCGICGSVLKIIKNGNARVNSGHIIGQETSN